MAAKVCQVCGQHEALYRQQTTCGPCLAKETHAQVAAIYAKREARNR